MACLDLDEDLASHAADEVRAVGALASQATLDVTLEQSVTAAFDKVEHELGIITVLVNGAVTYNEKGLLAMPFQQWRQQLAVILDGVFLCTRAVVGRLVATGQTGSIINISSTAAYQGEPGNVAYCTAKSGILNFTRSVAMEFAHLGIRVNSLSPTSTDPSEAGKRALSWGVAVENDRSYLDAIARHVPMHALPAPSDYGRAAVFLASDASVMMTGSELRVDAGSLARYWRWDPAEGVDE